MQKMTGSPHHIRPSFPLRYFSRPVSVVSVYPEYGVIAMDGGDAFFLSHRRFVAPLLAR